MTTHTVACFVGTMLVALGWTGTTLAHPKGVPKASVVETVRPPVIDGRFDEPAWSDAVWATGFVERKPNLGARPKDKTRFAVIYDADAVYIGIRMFDQQPSQIVAKTLTKDSFNIFSDDAVSVKMDPHHDHRTTYGFAVNAGSGNLDYKGVNESRFERGVDMVWTSASLKTSEGWNAEFRIPWSSLGIDPSAPPATMGFNISRDHPRRNATYDWSLLAPPYSPVSASRYGELEGFKAPRGASSSLSWSVAPYALAGFRRDLADAGVSTSEVINGGIDGSLALGQSFGMHLSVNTDFAQVDLDDQVVNLTRFGLFIEEKRDFFLGDLELFEFGRSRSAQLLYTRRIGLTSGGAEVPLMTGLKLVSRPSERVRMGLLHVTTRPLDGQGLPWEQHMAARLQIQADDGSTGGFMATWRQSYENLADRNLVMGFDGTWRGSGTPFLVNAFALLSLTGQDARSAGAGTGGALQGAPDAPAAAVGFDVIYRDLLMRPTLSYAYYAPDFRADLGFYRRVGGHQPSMGFEWVPRFNSGGLEKLEVAFELGAWVWDDSITPEGSGRFDWNAGLSAELVWEQGYRLGFHAAAGRAAVLNDFKVGASTDIAAGDYRESLVEVSASTPGQYVFSGSVSLSRADYFGGELYGGDIALTLKPSSLFRLDLTAGYDHAFFADASRDFDAATVNARVTLGFSPEIGASLYTGWNYLSDQLRAQLRFRWSYLPGSDLFVVYQLDAQPEPFTEVFQSLLLKVTFRYPWSG